MASMIADIGRESKPAIHAVLARLQRSRRSVLLDRRRGAGRGIQENVRRFHRRMSGMQRQFAAGRIGFDAIRPRILSWIGHARHANSYRLRADLFSKMPFQRATANPSFASGRDVHQSTGERPLGEP